MLFRTWNSTYPIPVNTYPELNISVAGDNKNTLSMQNIQRG